MSAWQPFIIVHIEASRFSTKCPNLLHWISTRPSSANSVGAISLNVSSTANKRADSREITCTSEQPFEKLSRFKEYKWAQGHHRRIPRVVFLTTLFLLPFCMWYTLQRDFSEIVWIEMSTTPASQHSVMCELFSFKSARFQIDYIQRYTYTEKLRSIFTSTSVLWVATISRLLKIIGLFCRIYSLLEALLQKRPIIWRSLLM